MKSLKVSRMLFLALLATVIFAVGCGTTVPDNTNNTGVSPTRTEAVDTIPLAEGCTKLKMLEKINEVGKFKKEIDDGKLAVEFDADNKTLIVEGVMKGDKSGLGIFNSKLSGFLKEDCVVRIRFRAISTANSSAKTTGSAAFSGVPPVEANPEEGFLFWLCPYECNGVCQFTKCEGEGSPTPTPTPSPSP
ncbi:MAG: hypothetical protein OEM82_12085 [Acidobacteriota bacterium]|nr:hypothetical protein [Acidobacteriota bacterium]MDH3531097.1 hypothetical protein [Acidobacteriota bacterium]